jgi:hypothetical protein
MIFLSMRWVLPLLGTALLAYQRSSDVPAIRCGDYVHLEGQRTGDMLSVRQATFVQRKPPTVDLSCSPVGTQRVAVILATFPGTPPPITNAAAVQRMLFAETGPSMATWYRRASHGKTVFNGSVFGPYTLDRYYNCEQTSAMHAHRRHPSC